MNLSIILNNKSPNQNGNLSTVGKRQRQMKRGREKKEIKPQGNIREIMI